MNFVRRLFGISEEPKELEWFAQVDEIKKQFDDINSEVQKAIKYGATELRVAAFDRASKELPELLRKLEALPPKNERRQESFARFTEGLTGYLLACRYFKKSLEENDEMAFMRAVGHLKEAGELMKEARKILKRKHAK